ARARRRRARTGRGPQTLVDPGAILDDMRLVKDDHEIGRIRDAARVTVEAFREAARVIRPGAGEWEVEAAIEAGFRRQGAQGFAFPSVVASGERAAVLHYIDNEYAMPADGLVLLDAGASLRHYAADVSRTFPVSGEFSPEQRSLYDVVLAARDAAIDAVRPGATIDDVHTAALHVLVRALVDHGLLVGDPHDLADDERAYKPFFPHRTSHWLGLEVHDVGDYARDGEPRTLEPGMILTVEPGLYIPDAETPGPAPAPLASDHGIENREPPASDTHATDDAAEDVDAEHDDSGPHPAWRTIPSALRGIGIRIEDDVLVTPDGHEILTSALPADADAVQRMVGHPEAW
ncbi:MAG: M24B family metallopeptidase, partial [Gemmatimonadota bacterium]